MGAVGLLNQCDGFQIIFEVSKGFNNSNLSIGGQARTKGQQTLYLKNV